MCEEDRWQVDCWHFPESWRAWRPMGFSNPIDSDSQMFDDHIHRIGRVMSYHDNVFSFYWTDLNLFPFTWLEWSWFLCNIVITTSIMSYPSAFQDRYAYRAMMQQSREAGPQRLAQIEEMRKLDPKGFALLMMEFRTKWLGRFWTMSWRDVL